MALLYTEVASREAAGPNLENRSKTAAHVGRALQIRESRYTMTGAEAAGDVINIMNLPVGAQVKPELCRVINEAVGGTGTALSKIGDVGDDDRYSATSISLTSAASTGVTPVGALTNAYVIQAGNETLKATVALSSGNTTAGKIVIFQIAYLLP